MKKILISALVAGLLIQALSCNKLVATVFEGIDVNVPEIQLTIPAVIIVSPNEILLGSFSSQLKLDSIIKANTGGVFGINVVNSIKVKQIRVTASNADQLNNLSNFENTRMTIQSNLNNNPTELFAVNFPDTYASTITVTPANSPDLLDYLKGSEITYKLYGKMRRITTQALSITIAVTVRVN